MVAVVSRNSSLRVGLLAAALTALGASDARAQGNLNPGVLPPKSTAYGKTYTEWAEEWWIWALTLPGDPDQNPFADPDGSLADVGQSGDRKSTRLNSSH